MGKANDYKNLWIEKYRPEKLEDLVLEDYIRDDIKKYAKAGEIPHLLFYGQAGGGKTTLAKVLVNEILDCEYHYINASDKSGVDVIRGEIRDFAERKSMDGKLKVIILDECDGLSSSGGGGSSAQQALRNIMEEYANNVRFILTANYFNKISNPIVSRCISYQVAPPLKEFTIRCFNVLKAEGVTTTRADFVPYAKQFYPDMRRAINSMQRDSVDGVLQIRAAINKSNKIVTDIVEIITSNGPVNKLREMLIQRTPEFSNDYRLLMSEIFNYVYDSKMSDDDKRAFLIELSSGMYKHEAVMDKEVNAYATLLKLY